jgi:hypothetical protein
MAELNYAIAINQNRPFPTAKRSDAARNGLKRLVPGNSDSDDDSGDDQEWHAASLEFLNEHAPNAGNHRTVDLAPVTTAGVTALDTPWYAVFETEDGEIWVARFFSPNLNFGIDDEGVFIFQVPNVDNPGLGPADMTAQNRPKRSAVAVSRDTVSGAPSASRDHGGGGGVIRTDWEA